MKMRPPLNGLTPRTMREACRDPWDWWQHSQRPDTPAEKIAGAVLAVVIGIIGAAAFVHWWAA